MPSFTVGQLAGRVWLAFLGTELVRVSYMLVCWHMWAVLNQFIWTLVDIVCCLAFVYRRADCWYVSPAFSTSDGAIKFVHVLHYFASVFCQDFVNDVDMLGADMTKLKCHAERLMSARHPAAAAIQVRWRRVTPEHLLTCSGGMRWLLFVTITYLCWW